MKKNVDSILFNILTLFLSFLWQIIHLKKKLMCTFFEENRGLRKCVLYIQLNVDNYG